MLHEPFAAWLAGALIITLTATVAAAATGSWGLAVVLALAVVLDVVALRHIWRRRQGTPNTDP